MQQLSRHAGLIISIIVIVMDIIVYFAWGLKREIPVIIGLFVVGALFFLLWLGQRGEN